MNRLIPRGILALALLSSGSALACQNGNTDDLMGPCGWQVVMGNPPDPDAQLAKAREICLRRWYFLGGEQCNGLACDGVNHPAGFTTPECVTIDEMWRSSGAADRAAAAHKAQDDEDEQFVKSVAGQSGTGGK